MAAEIRAGHGAAVDQAMGYLEREACGGRRGKGGAVQVQGDGFIEARFVHRTSRAGDPLLHTHVVTANLTEGPDERWTALDARHLYAEQKTGGYLYQAAVREQLDFGVGLEWGPVSRERRVAALDHLENIKATKEWLKTFGELAEEYLEVSRLHGDRLQLDQDVQHRIERLELPATRLEAKHAVEPPKAVVRELDLNGPDLSDGPDLGM